MSPEISLHAESENEDELEMQLEKAKRSLARLTKLHSLKLCQTQRVNLNVSGTLYQTSIPTLTADPEGYLAAMVAPESKM